MSTKKKLTFKKIGQIQAKQNRILCKNHRNKKTFQDHKHL